MSDPTASAVVRHDDLLIPIEGETVAASRYEPVDCDGPNPVVLEYTPYRKDDSAGIWDEPLLRYLARAGFEVVIADLVGTGASSGVKTEPFTADDGSEGAAIVDWLAKQEWSSGSVGMIGISYPGLTSLRTAAESPDSLDAIVPIMAPYSIYEREGIQTDSHFASGTLTFQAIASWMPMMAAFQALPPSRRDDSGRWAAVWSERLDALEETDHDPWLFQYLDHESPKDDYWANKEFPLEDVRRIEAATFVVDGWRDSFVHPNVAYFPEINGPKRLLLGPWRHARPFQGRETRLDFRQQVVDWFERFLRDDGPDTTDRPTITYWTEREGGGRKDGGIWRGTETWPTVGDDTESRSFVLTSGALVAAERLDAVDGTLEREYDHDHTVGIESTARYGPPTDTAVDDARSLAFETPSLTQPIEFTGTGEAVLQLASSIGDPVLAVRVVDVSPTGEARLVTSGHTRPSHRHGHRHVDPLESGESYTIPVSLNPRSHVFEEGHRIRLGISGAYFPLMVPPREQGSFTVRSSLEAPTTLTLPGREHGGGVTFDDTVSVGQFDDSLPAVSDSVLAESASLSTTREHLTDSATFAQDRETVYDLWHGDTMTHTREETATVKARSPGTAAYGGHNEVTLTYGNEEVKAVQESRVTRDAARLSVTVHVDGGVVFDRTWRW